MEVKYSKRGIKMPKNKRIKDGKTQYKAQFRWIDEFGKVHKSNTKWFNTKLEAQKEADKLKREKNNPIKPKSATKAIDIYKDYIDAVKKDAFNDELKNKSSAISLYQRLNTILNKGYFPKELQKMKASEINTSFFRKWLEYLNKQAISGETIRSYKTVLTKFNKYLADMGYYTNYNTDIEVAIGISRVDLKPKKTGRRKNRRVPTIEDIEAIRMYYDEDLGKFRNFYYYTFFYFEFYAGMRVSETIALQWKDIDLRDEHRVIHVRNAINGKEKRDIATKRTLIGNYSTKNETSERGVVIFDIIYQLLVDYKYRYKIHYHLNERELDNCFVFPALRDPHKYASHNHLLEELKRACAGAGIDELDNGMFRHGCATFLVAPEPEGLGYSPEQVYSQLGHCDSSMINEIYGRLQKDQMTRKNRATFNRIYHPEKDEKEKEHINIMKDIIHRVEGNNDVAEDMSKLMRFIMEAERVNNSKRKVYYYNSADEYLIELYNFKEKYPDIKFIKKD